MDASTKVEITSQILTTVAALTPKTTYRTIYGGSAIEMCKGDPKIRVAGVLANAAYVSLEFTKDINLVDPNQILKGPGKVRRHIKLRSLGDFVAKDCQTFLVQALTDPV